MSSTILAPSILDLERIWRNVSSFLRQNPQQGLMGSPAVDFSRHTLVRPILHHARTKRAIDTTKQTSGMHHPAVTLRVEIENQQYVLDLRLNEDLITGDHTISHQKDGKTITYKPTIEDLDICQYHGTVRGRPGSWAAVSTCRGVRGVIYDGKQMKYIEPSNDHYIYDHADLNTNFHCGYVGGVTNNASYDPELMKKHEHQRNMQNTRAARVYAPLNIFIALVGIEVWSERDVITLEEDGDRTLTNFLKYRREVRQKFKDGVVGKALKGPICTYQFSGGVATNHSEVIGLVATTIAHEMGHNFGMEHDTEADCECPDEKCIMSPSSTSITPTHWSSCSLRSLALSFERGMDYCLRNKPKSLTDSPTCGNGFVEAGEECDCGLNPSASCTACCDDTRLTVCVARVVLTQTNVAFCGAPQARVQTIGATPPQMSRGTSTIIPCRTAMIDLGLSDVDPGMVPDGAKCGEDKMCLNTRCVDVSAVLDAMSRRESSVCPSNCSGHGVCNSEGHCHCDTGFAPPLCALPGPGGSEDSGPASDPSSELNYCI
ncbi:unnamed protein product [Leptidea sinapis]|uniref:Peptidase M12B domain-containing protein n=1 Tax=Leptidea sinapis TaxID=189913 RepID=A0A5E4QDE8_9NEOP|nr:unnamed protein product [Leptidea sinapis]